MKKFSYRLGKVLKVRHIREDQVKAQMAREAAFLNQSRQQEEINKQQLDSHRSLVVRRGKVEADAIQRNAEYIKALELKEERLQQIIKASEKRMEGHRQAMVEARRESKKLETDRENKQADWQLERNRFEQNLLDERNNAARSRDQSFD